jgi:hypothetical protein
MPGGTWEEYRAQHVQSIIDLIDKDSHWHPSKEQINWLNRYATDLELVDLGARGVDATKLPTD